MTAHGIRLEIDCPGNALLRTEMRPENFHCLLQILAANAIYWLRGITEPRIRVSVEDGDDDCKLLFADNGPGIRADIGERIFEPLFSAKENGCGMGLTIARQLLEAHGGAIESSPTAAARGPTSC